MLTYAGFWRRLAAYLIDELVLISVQTTLATAVIVIAPTDLVRVAEDLSPLLAAIVWAAYLSPVFAAISWAYFALLESSPAGATLGKIVLGLRVTDTRGDPISFARASIRYWLKILSTLTLMIGWLMAGFTPRKQALHDLLAGTLVLRKAAATVADGIASTDEGEYWDGQRWRDLVIPMEGR